MPRRQGRQGGAQGSCPDEESLCAYAEDRGSGFVREGIAAHLKECETCTDLYQRLLEFERPRTPIPEADWTRAEQRLGNWMDGFLRAATRRVSETAQPVSVGAARGGWLSAWKIQWAFAVAATLVVSGAAYLVFFGSWGGYLRTVMHRSAAAPTTVAQSQQGAQPQSQNFPEATTSATQTAQPSTTNPPSSAKLTRNTQPVPAPAQPAAPVAPNQNAPTGPSAQTPVYEAQNPPASAPAERPRSDQRPAAPALPPAASVAAIRTPSYLFLKSKLRSLMK